jgi:hypothetical protein
MAPGKHAQRPEAFAPRVPRPAVRPRRGPSPRLLLVAGAAVVVTLSAVLWLVWSPWSGGSRGDDDSAPSRTGRLSTYGADWTTADGGRFRISVLPGLRATTQPSPGGCVPAPMAGHANVAFLVKLDNLGAKAARVPVVEVGANLGPLGTVRPSVLSLERSARSIELSPRADGQPCDQAAALGPQGRGTIPAHGSLQVQGMLGGVDTSGDRTASGLALIVRYHQAFPKSPGGERAEEFLVPFHLRAAG